MNKVISVWNNLSNEEKREAKRLGINLAISLVVRGVMKKKGMVKSFWFGFPRKPHTYK